MIKDSFNGSRDRLKRFAKFIALEEQKTGKDADALIMDPKVMQCFEAILIVDRRTLLRAKALLDNPDLQEAQVRNKDDSSQGSFAEVTRKKMERLTQLIDELPKLFAEYDKGVEKVREMKDKEQQYREKKEKQLASFIQITLKQLDSKLHPQ